MIKQILKNHIKIKNFNQKLNQNTLKYLKHDYQSQSIFIHPNKKYGQTIINKNNTLNNNNSSSSNNKYKGGVFQNNKNNSNYQQQQQQYEQNDQQIIEKAQQETKEHYEDIHQKRFLDSLKLDENYKEQSIQGDTKDQYSFVLERPVNAQKLDMSDMNIIEIENLDTFEKTPQLAHNLDIILDYPGHIFTMDEMAKFQKDNGYFLKNIPQTEDVDFDAIPPYIPPSKDDLLLNFARQSDIKYVMSTSTISSVLAQFYYLFSHFRSPSFENISSAYDNEPKKYMISQRKPITNYIRIIDKEKGIYAIDSDSGLFRFKNQILMGLGKVMENQLCLEPEEFNNILRKDKRDKEAILDTDHFRFMKLNNNICLRAQIDCRSTDANGDPFVFEIKTRALCPMRYDLNNYQNYFDYEIKQKSGLHSSFEREYYDMIRGAFLKYNFQLKIGRMDGSFVAYHNTKDIVGFEYVKREEIEKRIFGNSTYADTAFVICSKLLTTMVDQILEDIKGEDYKMLKIGYYSCSHYKRMLVFVELFKEETTWGDHDLIDQTDDIKDEYDYYTKYKKFTNKVIKYEFTIYPYINGVYQKSPNFFLNTHDQIEVQYKLKRLGNASFLDYMNFLHEAYKFDSINLDLTYVGAWVKNF